MKEKIWESRVRVQNFLTEDTRRGHSHWFRVKGWFAMVERPSSVGPPALACGTEDWRVLLGSKDGKKSAGRQTNLRWFLYEPLTLYFRCRYSFVSTGVLW
jgi:hypothetical protein